jgi:hypothetical protein
VNNNQGGGCFDVKRITILLFFAMATAAAVFALVSCDEESAKEVPVGVVVPRTGVLEKYKK